MQLIARTLRYQTHRYSAGPHRSCLNTARATQLERNYRIPAMSGRPGEAEDGAPAPPAGRPPAEPAS